MSPAVTADVATLDALCTLLESAGKVLGDIVGDPSVKRLLDAFARIPPKDRPIIAAILEREASLRELGDATADQTGLRLTRPNPHAHLYVRTVGPTSQASLPMEHDRMVRAGIEAAQRTPILFQPDIYPAWRRAVSE